MAFRKYANLPDLDSAPDVYETPLTRSVLPTGPPLSPTFREKTSEQGDESASGIDHQQLRPEWARDRFGSARVDAKDVDFSDRISERRKSYRVRSTKNGRMRKKVLEGEELSSADEDETVGMRIARLMREVEEVKDEVEKGNGGEETGRGGSTNDDGGFRGMSTVLRMSNMLRDLQGQVTSQASRDSYGPKQGVSIGQSPHGEESSTLSTRPPEHPSDVPIHKQAQENTNRVLSKAVDLEARLSALEESLGTSTTAFTPEQQPSHSNRSILTTLSNLEAQFDHLSNTTAPSLEGFSREIKRLTQDAARLEESRKAAARAAQEALKAKALRITSSAPTGQANGSVADPAENLELVAKVDALYNTLPTIEAVAPLLPPVIERLRTLRALHSDAAQASESLAELEGRQAQMGQELAKWREGVERVEQVVKEGEGTVRANAQAVEAWVRDLESRLEKFH